MKFLLRLFNLRRRDRGALVEFSPLFGLVAAANVVGTSFAKALFLGNNDYSALPWMFICASLFTVVAAFVYLRLIGRSTVARRFELLLGLAVLTFVVLGFLVNIDPSSLSLAIFTWVTGLGHLITIQTWAYSTSILPTRKARRLFPVFAAAATAGACGGGGLTWGLTPLLGVAGLLFLCVALMALSILFVRRIAKRFADELARAVAVDEDGRDTLDHDCEADEATSPIKDALKSIRAVPLLSSIAALAFLMQVASQVMDFQFSAALKESFDTDEMASFQGAYYAGAYCLTLFVALIGGSRITRSIGIGLAAAAAAVFLAIGAAASSAMFFAGASALAGPVFATSFAERVASFGIGRHATQAAMVPVDPKLVERAKFIIDGVFDKFGKIAISIVFLFVSEALINYGVLSPFVLVFSLLAVLVGIRLGRNYKKAVHDGLRGGLLDTVDATAQWGAREAGGVVRTLLTTDNPDDIRTGIELSRGLNQPIPARLIERLLRHNDPAVVASVLETLQAEVEDVGPETFARLLEPSNPPEVIRSALKALPRKYTGLAPRVESIVHHPDASVASLAYMWVKAATGRSASAGHIISYEFKLLKDLTASDPETQRSAVEEVAKLGLPEYIEPLLDALGKPELRATVSDILQRMERSKVLEAAAVRLADDVRFGATYHIWLARLVEQLGGTEAAEIIAGLVATPSLLLRTQAIQSLWRLTRDPSVTPPLPDELLAQLKREIDSLLRMSYLDAALVRQANERRRLLRREIGIYRAQGERRAFRLLGMLFSRSSMARAYQHYRDPDPRVRSNAIELLDTTIDDPEIRRFVGYIESSEHQDGASVTSVSGVPGIVTAFLKLTARARAAGQDPVEELFGDDFPWLKRIYLWSRSPSRCARYDAPPPPRDESLERLLMLCDIPLFERVSGSELLPIADVARQVGFEAGEFLMYHGDPAHDMYIILDGEVDVLRHGHRIATLDNGQCIGEMGVLDSAPRSASVQAVEETRCLRLTRTEFDVLLELFPSMAKGIIDVLVGRLRNALMRADRAKTGEPSRA